MLSGSSRGWLLSEGWEAERDSVASRGPGPCHLNETNRADPGPADKFKQGSRLPGGFGVTRQGRGHAGNSVHRSGSGPVCFVVELGAGSPLELLPLG